MSKEGNLGIAGIIVITAIALIIGASLIPTLGQYTGQMLNSYNLVNGSYTIGANGAYVDLLGQELLNTATVTLGTNLTVPNVTIEEGVSATTGNKVIRMKTNDAKAVGQTAKVSYTYGAEGYVEDGGSRAMIPLIIVFFALLIMVVAIIPVFRQGFLEMVGLK